MNDEPTVTPPADDVREALAGIFRDYGVSAEADDDSILHAQLGDAILAAFEVRSHGTVTPPADDVREALVTEVRALIASREGSEWAEFRIDMVRRLADAAEVRPCGTVTDTEVANAVERIRARLSYASIHWGAEGLHPDALPHIARAALETAREVHP